MFLETLEDEEMMEFALTAWKLWKRKNEVVFNNVFLPPNSDLQSIKHLLEDIHQLQQLTK